MNEQFREFLSAQGVDCEDLRPLGEGTSNDTYLLGKALVYREKKPSDPYFYQPLYEKRAIMEGAKKGIAVPALLFDEKTGDMVSLFIPGNEHFPTSGASKEDIEKAVKAIKAFHECEVSLPPFDPLRRLSYYQDEAGARLLFAGESEIVSSFEQAISTSKLVPSHNDLVGSNVPYLAGKALLIDFEFAGYNDPYFDLASLLSENKIEDEELISEALYDLFGIDSDPDRLALFLAFEDILWGYWALYRFKMSGNPIFQEIYQDKKAAYARRPLFKTMA